MSRSKVLLPEPERPKSPMIWPSSKLNWILSRTNICPPSGRGKDWLTSLICKRGGSGVAIKTLYLFARTIENGGLHKQKADAKESG